MEPAGRPHAFTVDVEDHFHSEIDDPAGWVGLASRVEHATRALLETCAETGVRATFFVLGWVAERHPALVREIVAGGHELASHGWDHRFVYRQSPEQFRADVIRARATLEDLGGVAVRGYRAPYFSFIASTPWAYDVLGETGHVYSSSVFPGSNPRYGIPGHPHEPIDRVTRTGARVREVAVTTFFSRIGCGGVYFRALPYPWFAHQLARLTRERRAAVFYIHPWELDPGNPVAHGSLGLRLRHTVGVAGASARLRRLMRAFRFAPLGESLGLDPAPSPLTR